MTPLLEVTDLKRDYALPRRRLFERPGSVRALHGVSFAVAAGESFGIVGESGCGKSTLARAVLALEHPTSGTVRLLGHDLSTLRPRALKAMRRHMSMVFQDPYGSLDPRHRIARIVAEPMASLMPEVGRAERAERVREALSEVGLGAAAAGRYPHEFSGGQRQRVAIARALITRPELVVADEPVSALDVSVQAQVLNLMLDLRERLGLSYLFISHDLSVVRCVTDRVAVMYLGRIVETGPTAEIFARPRHPYTQALLDAVPCPDPLRRGHRHARGEPAPGGSPGGCPYAPRCPRAAPACAQAPALLEKAPGQAAACHFA
ncbi:MAG TPA: oligopeptide/dipeptide ABC transporter ATP-binding protein [Azospirillum sp.]|nr:oligopeptide/dipeptide ABC transporter ATP-binding protein [Azospirillum sp.]